MQRKKNKTSTFHAQKFRDFGNTLGIKYRKVFKNKTYQHFKSEDSGKHAVSMVRIFRLLFYIATYCNFKEIKKISMYVTKFFTIFKICVFTSNNTMAETVKQPPTQTDGL